MFTPCWLSYACSYSKADPIENLSLQTNPDFRYSKITRTALGQNFQLPSRQQYWPVISDESYGGYNSLAVIFQRVEDCFSHAGFFPLYTVSRTWKYKFRSSEIKFFRIWMGYLFHWVEGRLVSTYILSYTFKEVR